jgi:hypothetical protein
MHAVNYVVGFVLGVNTGTECFLPPRQAERIITERTRGCKYSLRKRVSTMLSVSLRRPWFGPPFIGNIISPSKGMLG